MPETKTAKPDARYLLSELLDAKVILSGKKVGRLSDLVIVETGTFPVVKYIVVSRPFGDPSLLVPWEQVTGIEPGQFVINISDIKKFETAPAEDAILLRDHILDKKVLDTEDAEVEVVYDIRLVERNGRLYVTEVDTSRKARLRRFGFGAIGRLFPAPGDKETKGDSTISWKYVQPLPTHISSFKGDVKLTVLKETLAEIHPVDLADIIEELDHDQRLAVFSSLETAQASDTLEEIEPNVQRDIIASLDTGRVVPLINMMTPGQAADVLSVIPHEDAAEILSAIHPDNARKAQAIMEKQEEKVIHYTTQKILKFLPDTTVEYVQNDYPGHARGKDVVMYIYVVDSSDRLLGVIDLKELLSADDKAKLSDIMIEMVITLNAESTLKEASQEFARYNFRALPVTDDDNHLIGVIPYRDVMNLT
ncbi:MAG TPA: CBS domain-containing protein, partial [Methanoregula sp.]|nr:CBS domain-containing protein [Methanoregula sp.]